MKLTITRRSMLALAACGPSVRAGTVNYRSYSACLPGFLERLATEAYQRRKAALLRLTTPDAIRQRQAWVRRTFWKLAGGEPQRTPLNLRTLGAFERDGYRVERIVYESVPGLHVPANLYIPTTGTPPYPGVLFQMGHSLNGKCAIPYQKCCQGLAKLGYVVLAFDPMGQGERTYYPRADGGTLTRLSSADDEHTIPGQQMILVGDTATRMQVWDAVRSLDVLAAHPMVDAKRLASTGQSGGGTLTMMLAAVDDRLAAAAVSCGNTEDFACAGFIAPGSTDDAEQNFINSGPDGFDRWDLLYPMAPKPLLVLISGRDFFGTYSPRYVANGREGFAALQRAYGKLGAPADRLAWDETPAPHALAYYLRTRIYAWFDHWLKGKPRQTAVAEPAVSPEPDQTLWVGATGNAVRDFQSKTPLLLARERLRPPAVISRQRLMEILKLDAPTGKPGAILSRVPSEQCDLAAMEVESVPGVHVPAWLFTPRDTRPDKPVVVMVEPGGRAAQWGEGLLSHQLAAAGITVCATDVRGIGDLRPEAGKGNPGYAVPHTTEDHYAWASMILGKPMVGQRVTDLLAIIRALPALIGPRRIVLAARGSLTVPAVMAAALEPAVSQTYLCDGLRSYRSILDTEHYPQPFANFLFDLARETDLPEIEALCGPRRVIAGTRWTVEALSTRG